MRKSHSITTYIVGFALLVLAGGCGGNGESKEPRSEMTEAKRDSIIAASQLPGAGVVGRALEVADSADARAQRLDEEYK